MIRYNAEKHCFENVSTAEYEKEFFENLKKTYGDVATAFDPIKQIRRNMDKSETSEVNFINFDIDDQFEFKQSDFDEKETLVESAMDRIFKFQESRYSEKFGMVVEQQLRRAWNKGYKCAVGKTLWNLAKQDVKKEFDAESAKNEGRKEVWDMVRRLYLADEVENAYDLADLQKAFGTVTFSEILLEDVHEVLAKDKERLKRIEGEKIIRPGDEVEVDPAPLSDSYKGWVADAQKSSVGKARWITQVKNYVEQTWCSKCGKNAPFVFVTDDHYGNHAHGETVKTRFCPNCGKRMENSI